MVGLGCATEWKSLGSYPQVIETMLDVTSEPPGSVYLGDRLVGNAPITVPLRYQRFVERRERKVAYWRSQSVFSLLLTIASLGLYIPFGMIPVDPEFDVILEDRYSGAEFEIFVRAEGFTPFSSRLILHGQERHAVHAELRPEGS